ncbi:tetratricopeptide repeat protein [Sphingobacterium sp. SRCM116780]|uniref:tetratricopeptide repeat protein n=1 Tax=Sphingobacterium sp. SRCM116780 TaxID=2907623 RepID=UPI001F1A1D8C|nr:tetratricopeptide repeat protein [Sphingobacterium sp. SRCM116780]UIR56517.1 tetratricopeptide repeat protein [Sphingobacterium sp. SRCM116780]
MTADRLQQLLDFLKDSPQDPFLKYALATEYLKLGNQGEALNGYLDLIANHEDYVGTYYHLGKLYEKLNQLEDAREIYKKGMLITQQKRNMHALSELRGALSLLDGDDEDEY